MLARHMTATQHAAPAALRRPFDGLRDWPLPAQPAASPLRHHSPLGCLDNVYTSSYSPKLLPPPRAGAGAPPGQDSSKDSSTQTCVPSHRDNVYASSHPPKPLPPGAATDLPTSSPGTDSATQTAIIS